MTNPYSHRNLWDSFVSALKGLGAIVMTQRNARIIFICGVLAVGAGVMMNVSVAELLILLLTAGLVFVAEIFNTMVEEIINLSTSAYNPRIKFIKDIAAAAVLTAVCISVVVGIFIFGRRLVGV